MTHDQSTDKAEVGAVVAPDDRETKIERLERAIAEERQHSATLRKTLEELRFKTETLEKSYAKQLDDARLLQETAEQEITEQRARIAALEAANEDTMRLLAEARSELERISAPRAPGRRSRASVTDRAEAPFEDGSQTINRLMNEPNWKDKPADHAANRTQTQPPAEQDSSAEELVAPDLVFTAEGDENT